jgi:hypothetical protein
VINFRPKTKPGKKLKKQASKVASPRVAKRSGRELTAAEIAEINLFDRVIAKMNARVS